MKNRHKPDAARSFAASGTKSVRTDSEQTLSPTAKAIAENTVVAEQPIKVLEKDQVNTAQIITETSAEDDIVK